MGECRICEKFSRKNSNEPLRPYPLPDRPWQRVGCDIFSIYNLSYLVLYDAYSNWLELVLLTNKSASELMMKFKSIFSKYGVPDIVLCDNVPFKNTLL